MKKHALIMAGGVGRRAGTPEPKQLQTLCGLPMLWHSVRAFHSEDTDTEIVIVMHPDYFDRWDELASTLLTPADREINYRLVAGGKDRGESVANGLNSISCDIDSLVAVHDAARPMVTVEMIARGWAEAAKHGACVPVVPVTDSLREVSGQESRAVDRSRFVAVQTPQVFRGDILRDAYALPSSPVYTDDASRVEACGVKVALYEGEPSNIKVTNPMDFAIAEALLQGTK